MAKNKLDRDTESREKSVRRPRWKRPNVLPEVDADKHPDYDHRYIRVSMNGEMDAKNIASRIREGWEPCLAKDYPEIDVSYIEHEKFKDNIVLGGQMLCRAPKELVAERNDFYKQQANNQVSAVDNNLMRENDPRMPLFAERQTTTSFGKGKN